MGMLWKKRVLKIMVAVVCLLIGLPHLIFKKFATNLSREDIMKRHFKKASIFETSKTRALQENKTMFHLLNGPKSKTLIEDNKKDNQDNIALLKHMKNVNRWKEQNHILDKAEIRPISKPEKNLQCEYGNYSTFQTGVYCLRNDSFDKYYSTENQKHFCFKEGTEFILNNGSECFCKSQWHGPFCSMHDVVYHSSYPHEYGYMFTNPPRRLIYAFPFSLEFDMLETRFNEYSDIVDLYIIVESNYTAAGQPKPRRLLERLKLGEFKSFQPKILYVSLDYFPKKAYYNGWLIDGLLRNVIADYGLDLIQNLRDDDVFFLSDADELPVREALAFLKLHQSYPEPVGLYITHNVYNFGWWGSDNKTHVYGACSIGMLRHVFKWQPYALRSAKKTLAINTPEVEKYKFKHFGRIHEWSLGNVTGFPAGWHCSWCFSPQGIKSKLEAAHWSDLPRWGAYPSKTSVDYIYNLTQRGIWFDDRTKLQRAPHHDDWRSYFAPKYILAHQKKFSHLLGHFIKPRETSNTIYQEKSSKHGFQFQPTKYTLSTLSRTNHSTKLPVI